ncbi:MAG: CDP-archaeol synthase [Patescibacteria group bacterium]
MVQFILQCFWFIVPMGVANVSASVVKKQWQVLARPVDGGRKLLGQPLFGEHKTWRGFLVGTLSGGGIFILQQAVYAIPSFKYLSFFDYPDIPSYYGFVIGFGALFGDLVRAFFKRRFRLAPGARWLPFDQIDYIIGGLVFASFYVQLSVQIVIMSIIVGFAVHVIANHIGYYLKIKDTRW